MSIEKHANLSRWLAAVSFLLIWSTSANAQEICDKTGKTANLDFMVKDINGVDVALGSYRGKVILLDFWATWCGPCKVEIPGFVELYKKYQSQGLVVLGFSMDDSMSALKSFAEQYKMNYPVLVGKDREDVQDAFAPLWGLPNTFLIGRDGKICKKHAGFATKEQFEREIKELLTRQGPRP